MIEFSDNRNKHPRTPILRQRGIYTQDFRGRLEFLKRVRECQTKAHGLFPDFKLKVEELPVVFVRSGRIAGMAKRQRNIYNLEFSVEAILKDWEEMITNTIPHEMAHIVDMYLHGGHSSHGPRWKYIVQRLGGSSDRTHDIPLNKSRRSRKYIYQASCGTVVEVGPRHHNTIAQGGKLTVKRTGGLVTRKHFTGRSILK